VSVGGGEFAESVQRPVDGPVFLYRRRSMRSNSKGMIALPADPVEGLMLWIEPVSGPDPAP